MMRKAWLCFLAVTSMSLTNSCGKKSGAKKNDPASEDKVPVSDPGPSGPKPEPTLVSRGELNCYDHGGYLTGCTLQEKVLSDKLTNNSKFTLEYSFNCVGSQMAIIVQFGELSVPLKQEAAQKIELIGTGPFVLKDADPDWSKSADLQPGCSLDIGSFAVTAI